MPKAHFEHYPIRSQVANFAASSNDKSAKKKHIFSIPGPNAVIDFAALQARKRPKKPNKLKLGILHDRVEHYSDPARVDAALEQWDRDAATRCAQLIAVDQDIVDTHARVSTAQCAIAVALRPFAMFLAAQAPCNLVVAGDERFHVTRPLSASLDTILVAYRKHRRVLRKLLDSRTGATTLEPFDITGELVSIQTPPVSESIEEMCALRVAFSTNAIAWHVRLFDAYEAVIARFTESLHSAIKRVPDRIVVAVTGDELTTLRDTLNELERGYVAYARHAIVFDRSIAEISEIPAERELVIEQQRRSVLALQNSQAKLDQKLAVLKATSDDNDNSAKTNANDGADDDNDDDDNDNDEVAVVVDDETPPMPEDFKALELALKSESVVAFYRKLQRFPAVEPAPRASYVTIEPTEELMSAVVAILNRLDRLQVRGKKSGAVRAKRLDIGMHATRMRLEARSAFAIVLATDIEPVRTLLDEIAALQALAHRRRVPVICMMTRRELATAVNRQNDAGEKLVSVVTIVSVSGAEREFRALRAMWIKERDRFIREQREKEKAEN
jgi:ribosomal protein L7Ae-like RNA K-turn-binding protein